MNPAERALEQLEASGVQVTVEEGRLILENATEEHERVAAQHKAGLIALLTPPAQPVRHPETRPPAATPRHVTRAIRHQASQDVGDQVVDEAGQRKAKPARQRGPNGRWQSDRATTAEVTSMDGPVEEEAENDTSRQVNARPSWFDRIMYGNPLDNDR